MIAKKSIDLIKAETELTKCMLKLFWTRQEELSMLDMDVSFCRSGSLPGQTLLFHELPTVCAGLQGMVNI